MIDNTNKGHITIIIEAYNDDSTKFVSEQTVNIFLEVKYKYSKYIYIYLSTKVVHVY